MKIDEALPVRSRSSCTVTAGTADEKQRAEAHSENLGGEDTFNWEVKRYIGFSDSKATLDGPMPPRLLPLSIESVRYGTRDSRDKRERQTESALTQKSHPETVK